MHFLRAASFCLSVVCLSGAIFGSAAADDVEFTGQFDKKLVANTEDFERVVLKTSTSEQWRSLEKTDPSIHYSTAKLINPQSGKASILSVLVEEEGEFPVIFVDVNHDGALTPDEGFPMEKEKDNNPYLWIATASVNTKKGYFTSCPILVRYLKSVRSDDMAAGDRLITQSTEVHARGSVNVNGKPVLVQYAMASETKVTPLSGWLGVDTDGDGLVDMNKLSPEAARADMEAVVFKVGDLYLSTKKADVSKNQIILRAHEAKDYKRLELRTGDMFPDFSFSDFDGKKRKFDEFRGKYVLLDIWGFWCPPCRKELPYIKEAQRRYASRNLEVVGLNTDENYTVSSMKKALKDNGMIWTQAKFDSVVDFLRQGLRITSYPTTFLISPEGKIISMSRHERGEPNLRGNDLLESLDEVLPE